LKRVWITRAEPGASSTAFQLAGLGFAPVVAPLLAIAPLPARIDLTGVAALAFTSANGVRVFATLCSRRDLPVFAVGAASAAAAGAAGFDAVHSANGAVSDLARLIADAAPDGIVLHAGAVELAGDLAGDLKRLNVAVRTAAIYESIARAPPGDVIATLSTLSAVLLHSPAASRRLVQVLAGHDASGLDAYCLSETVAEALDPLPLRRLWVAPMPSEQALLSLLRDPRPSLHTPP
jgi:uroporphyrinogen-III synthase